MMREFIMLIGQLFLIACVQSFAEIFIDPAERPYQAKVLTIACFAGSFVLLMQFILTHVLGEVVALINFPY